MSSAQANSAVAVTPAAASTSAAVAATTPATSAAAAATTSASVVAAASSSVPAAGSSAVTSASAVSSAAAVSTSAPASSAAVSSSTIASSASSSAASASVSSRSSRSATIPTPSKGANNDVATEGTGGSGLSGGAIGGIVGGVVGGLLLLGLLFWFWRRRRDKKDWVPPPPPREISYNSQSIQRQRAVSSTMLAGSGTMNRASSYSTLLHGRPSSQYAAQSHSRNPSFYATYPVATPSAGSHEHSPPVHPAVAPLATPGSSSSENSPPLSGKNSPGIKPALAPINTALHRDGSDSSDGRTFARKSSVDRLRQEAASSRAPSPAGSAAGHERNPSESGSSRATSPRPSLYGGMPSPQRQSFSSSLAPGASRPYSMHSLNSTARMGGAPHTRHVQLEMPRLLGARPDSNGDFFSGMPTSRESMTWGTMDGHIRRGSRAAQENDFAPPSPPHMSKRPSSLGPSALSQDFGPPGRRGHDAV